MGLIRSIWIPRTPEERGRVDRLVDWIGQRRTFLPKPSSRLDDMSRGVLKRGLVYLSEAPIFICLAWFLLSGRDKEQGTIEFSMVLCGVVLAISTHRQIPQIGFLRTLPVRASEVARSGLRLVFHGVCFISLTFFLFWTVWNINIWTHSAEAAVGFALDVFMAFVLFASATVFALALYFPTAMEHGGLPVHRRFFAVYQGFFLLFCRWSVGSIPDLDRGLRWVFDGLTLVALVGLAFWTLRTQLAAADRSTAANSMGIGFLEKYGWYVVAVVYLLSIAVGGELLSFLFLAPLVMFQLRRLWQARGQSLSLVVRCLNSIFVLVLVGTELGAYFDRVGALQRVQIELVVLVTWFIVQNLVENPRQVRLEAGNPSDRSASSWFSNLRFPSWSRDPTMGRYIHQTDIRPSTSTANARVWVADGLHSRTHRLDHLMRIGRKRFWTSRPRFSVADIWAVVFVVYLWVTWESSIILSMNFDTQLFVVALLIAWRVADSAPSKEFLHTLPVRPIEIVLSRLRGSFEVATVTAGLMFVLWVFRNVVPDSLGLEFITIMVIKVVGYLVVLGSILVFFVALGFPAWKKHGALSFDWRLCAALQGLAVLESRATVSSIPQLGTGWQLVIHGIALTLLLAIAGTALWVQLKAAIRVATPRPAPLRYFDKEDEHWTASHMFILAVCMVFFSFGYMAGAWTIALLVTLFKLGDLRGAVRKSSRGIVRALAFLCIITMILLNGVIHFLPHATFECLLGQLAVAYLWFGVQTFLEFRHGSTSSKSDIVPIWLHPLIK